MKNTQRHDAFGLLLTHHFAGETCCEFIERDDGYLVATDNLDAYFATFCEWPPRMQQAMQFVRGRVLDVGLGAGRFALYLQEQGHEVVGIDVSPGALEISRKRGVADTRQLAFHKVDASLGIFDTVLMMGQQFRPVRQSPPGEVDAAPYQETHQSECPYRGRVARCLRHRLAGASCLP